MEMYMKHRHTWSFNLWTSALVVIGVLASLIGASAFAQTTSGTIRGTVTGSGGAPIVSAQIVARNVSSGATRTALSNDAGAYVLVGLVPGIYDVNVRRIGSAPQSRQIVVQIGATQVQDFSLRSEEHTSELQSPCNLVCRLL